MIRWREKRVGLRTVRGVATVVAAGVFATMLSACGDEDLIISGKPLPTPPPATSTPDDNEDL